MQLAGFLVAPARQGRDGRGAARARRRHARARPPDRGARARPSTSSAPAATGCTRSTSRRWPPSSWRPPGCGWSSTATGRPRRASGSADVLEALGVALTLTPDAGGRGRRRRPASPSASPAPSTPSMRHAAVTRRDLGVGTAFNVLGPLTNPAQPTYAGRRRAPTPGSRRSWPGCSRAAAARHRSSAATTASTSSPSPRPRTVWWVRDGAVTELDARPAPTSGLDHHPVESLRGGDAAHNAQVARDLLAGAHRPGARRRAAQRRHRAGDGIRAGRADRVAGGARRRPCATGWTAPRPPSTPARPQAAAGPVGRDATAAYAG